MSGGHRGMFIYQALVSPAPVILLDEALSALIADRIQKVASALVNWERRDKIILLIGHGMSNFMSKQNVINLALTHDENNTLLKEI